MKKGLLFMSVAALLSVGLVACGKDNGSSGPVVTYEVKITNKDALSADWTVGGANRNVNVEIPGVKVADEWGERLFLTSSNTSAVQVSGLNGLKAVGEGTSRITVTFMNAFSDYVDVTVTKEKSLVVVTNPVPGKDYFLSMNSASGRRFVQNRIDGYYIGTTDDVSKAATARIAESSVKSGDYQYKITLTGVEDETTGKSSTRTIGGYDSTGHINIGFVETTDVYPYAEQAFKFNSDYTFSTVISSNEYWIGTYSSYNTLSYRGATQIEYKAMLFEYGEPVVVENVSLNKNELALNAGSSEKLVATVTPSTAVDPVTWSSNETTVATVDKNGVVAAIKAGTATITASCGGKSATCVVTVSGQGVDYGTVDNPITVNAAKAIVDAAGAGVIVPHKIVLKGIVSTNKAKDSNGRFEIWLQNDDGTTAKAWECYSTYLDESIKGYDAADSMVGCEVVVEGWATLFNTTYEFTNKDPDGNYDNATVKKLTAAQPAVLTGIKLDKTTCTVEEGETVTLTVSPIPANAQLGTVSWESQSIGVATVDNTGKVTGVSKGQTTIMASCGGFTDSCVVTVTEKQEGTKVTVNMVDVATKEGIEPGKNNKVSEVKVDDKITAVAAGSDANTGKLYNGTSGDANWRLYKSGSATLTITPAEGYEIKSASIVYGVSGWEKATDPMSITVNNGVALLQTTAVGSNVFIYSITVVYAAI